MAIDDAPFQSLLEQVRELHRLSDELTRQNTRIHANVRARLYWNPKVPDVPAGQEALADEIHELLGNSRLSAQQAAQLEREYFPPRGHL